jgi:DNA-binding GntR family transcriptional regulator
MASDLKQRLEAFPLVERIAERLSNAILAGEIPLGSKLREQSLAASLGVSRGPLREAIRRLEGRHLIERVPNHGPRVISLDASDIHEIFMLREALEGIACRVATELMTADEIGELEKLVERQLVNLNRKKYTFESNLDFHERIIQGAKNARLTSIVQLDLCYLIRIYRARSEVSPGRDRRAIEEHREIVTAMSERNPELAENLMRRHVRNSRDNIVRIASGDAQD